MSQGQQSGVIRIHPPAPLLARLVLLQHAYAII